MRPENTDGRPPGSPLPLVALHDLGVANVCNLLSVVPVTLAAALCRKPCGTYPVDIEITDNPLQHRYEARLGQDVLGFIDYHLRTGGITLLHTEVDRAAEGRGVGSQLVAGTLEDIRGRRLSVVVVCPFIRAYIRRHPEYADVVAAR